MATIASLKVNILGDSTGLSNSLKSATDKMQAFGDRMTQIGSTLSTRLTLPIIGFGALAVKSASDAEETFSKFATVFRDVGANADEAFKSLRDNYGLSSKASKQLLSDTGDLLTGFGFSQQSALELSTEVNKLAVDLASFTNFSGGAEGASQALTKALLGERESIKSLGIAIMEEDVQKRVAINTTKGLTFETERQAKAFATLQLAQEQSKNAIGDYERTQDSFANQFRLLQARASDLATEFGTIMLPTLNKMITIITKATESFSKMDEGTKRLIIGISVLVAGVGPLLLLIGGLTKAFTALNVVMLANPYTALAMAVLAIGTAAYFALAGLDDMNKQIRQSIGLKEELTGSEDEYNKLIKKQQDLNAERLRIEGLIAKGVSPQQGQALGMELGKIDNQMKAVRALAREWDGASKVIATATTDTSASVTGFATTVAGVDFQSGSIGALEAELEGLQAQLKTTGDTLNRAQLGAQINQLTAEIKAMKDVAMANILPITNPLERATIATQNLTSSIAGLNRGFIPLAKAPVTITEMTASMVIAQEVANQFTNSFGAGMANLIVQGGKLSEVLSNIGKLLLSSAIQTGIKLLLMGTSGFGVVGGSKGLLGGLFSTSVSTVPTAVMGAGTTSVTGTFKVQGTDLIAVINRSERQLR
jgi:dimeric dUTPase (all-alpha-NTP-PPase superfamily)/multisubunit Na+/H+ antiporter MnhG subunit